MSSFFRSRTKGVFSLMAVLGCISIVILFVYSAFLAIKFGGVSKVTSWSATERNGAWIVSRIEPATQAYGKILVGDQILALDGDRRARSIAPDLILQFKPARASYSINVMRGDKAYSYTIEADSRTDYRNIKWFVSLLIVGLTFFCVGTLIGLFGPADPVSRIGCIFCLSCAVHMVGVGLHPIRSELTGINAWFFAAVYSVNYITYAQAYHLTSFFPALRDDPPAWPVLRRVLYILSLFLLIPAAVLNIIAALGPAHAISFYYDSRAWLPSYRVLNRDAEGCYQLIALIGIACVFASRYRRISQPDQLRRFKWLVHGGVAGLTPLCLYAVALLWLNLSGHGSLTNSNAWYVFVQATNVAVIIVPITLGYAIIKHRVLDINFVVRRGLQYLFAKNSLRAMLMFPLFFLLWRIAADPTVSMRDAILSHSAGFYIGTSLAAAISLRYRKAVMSKVDRRFFRDSYDREQILVELVEEMSRAVAVEEMCRLVVERVDEALHVDLLYLFYREAQSNEIRCVTSPETSAASSVQSKNFFHALPRQRYAIEIGLTGGKIAFEGIDYLRSAGVSLVIPILGNDQLLMGALLLGQKKSEEPYVRNDRTLLQAITTQFAVICENLWLRNRGRDEALLRNEVVGKLGPQPSFVKECRLCGRCFDEDQNMCSHDGSKLEYSLPVGRILSDRYRLDRRIGAGGFGTVYEAFDISLSRQVAVKLMSGSILGDPQALNRFEREAQSCAKLRHPNIVTIHDFGVVKPVVAFLVMELLNGQTARAELNRQGRIPSDQVRRWIDDMLSGLIAAHADAIIHCDLKPDNLLIARPAHAPEVLKILDFGLAKIRPTHDSMTLTMSGSAVGTLGYMSPEQLRGESVDERTDIFAAGVLTFELLAGHRPFVGNSLLELLHSIYEEARDHLVGPEVNELDRVLGKCLAPNRDNRYNSVLDLKRELIPAIDACGNAGATFLNSSSTTRTMLHGAAAGQSPE